MHILYFHQYFSTPKGSTGTRSYEMSRRLVQCGHRVTVVCASYGVANTGLTIAFKNGRREGLVDGINVIELELPCSNRDSLLRRTWMFLKYSLRSSLIALTEKSDVVFATSTPLTAAIPGLVAAWLGRRPFVFEVRDLWPELPKAMGVIKNPLILWAMAWLERRAYRAAKHCIGLAPGIVDGISRHIDRERVSLIPNGCDLELFNPARVIPWRPDSVAPNEFLAVFTGTHGPANGLHSVLDAAEVLKKRGRTDINILLLGDGKQKDELVQRAMDQGLDNVVFHGNVSKEKVAGLLASADVGMQVLANIPAFYYGTSPNKFFDYLAAGLPIVNNYPGWVADLIRDKECGIAVPPDLPEAFADALQSMAENRDELGEMGRRARCLAEREFDRDKLAAKFVQVLEEASDETRETERPADKTTDYTESTEKEESSIVGSADSDHGLKRETWKSE